jgi:hypothetical protein
MHDLPHILLALTPMERWSATRQLQTEPGSSSWFLLVTGALLVVLVVLLVAVSIKQRARSRVWLEPPPPETPAPPQRVESAPRPAPAPKAAPPVSLTGRENQILLGIAMCGGDQDSQDIFTSAEAFDQGAQNLLAECIETRTAEEREKLREDIATLRSKLGFSADGSESGATAGCSSSRDIPVGARLELTSEKQQTAIEGRVVHNDILALALELPTRLDSRPGDLWHVCGNFGSSVWEFDTTVAACEGRRLTLEHSSEVRRANRRRFPRVIVHAPALVAQLPFLREDAALPEEISLGATTGGSEADALAAGIPTFVEARVTELAGLGLRIETSLRLEPDDMLVVVFSLAENGKGELHRPTRTMAVAGRVKHCQTIARGMSVGVQLGGLNDKETEELVLVTREIASRTGAASTENAAAGALAATSVDRG